MTSSILCAQTGADSPEIFEHSASYIASWLTALGNDHRLVITAAAHAQRASDLICQPERQLGKDGDHQQHAEPSGSEHAPDLTQGPAPESRQADTAPGKPETTRGHRDLVGPHLARPPGTAAEPTQARRTPEWQAEAG